MMGMYEESFIDPDKWSIEIYKQAAARKKADKFYEAPEFDLYGNVEYPSTASKFNLNTKGNKMSTDKSNTPNLFNLALTMIPEMKFYGVLADFQKPTRDHDPVIKSYTYCSLLNLDVGDKVLVLMGGKLAKAEIVEIQKETAIDVFATLKYGMIESTIDSRPALDAEKAANSVIEILENARREQATRSAKQLILSQLGLDQTAFSIENLTGDNHAED